ICGVHWIFCRKYILEGNQTSEGVALAWTMTQFVGLLLISLYIIITKPSGRDVWILPSKEVLKDFLPFARVMIGIGAMGYFELLIYKIAAFIAVFLPAPQFAAL